MGIAFVVCLLILLGIAFDLGRKWERMEWDGSFDEQEAAQQSFAPDAPPESCEHGNLRGKCPVEICSYSKHGGRR